MFQSETDTIFISANGTLAVRLRNPEGRRIGYYQNLLFRYGNMFGFKRLSRYITSANWVDIHPDAATLSEVGVKDEDLIGKTNISRSHTPATRMLKVDGNGIARYYLCSNENRWTHSSGTRLRRPRTTTEKFAAIQHIAKTSDVLIGRDDQGALTFECSHGPLFVNK